MTTDAKFSKRASNKRWAEENPEKQKEAIKRWKKNNPDKLKEYAERGRDAKLEAGRKYRQTEKYQKTIRANWYKIRYGISMEVYQEMLETQNEVCAICHNPETAKNNRGQIKPLAVDHCHSSGKVRGLLCHSCNVLLGRARDNEIILQNAIKYLRETKGDMI